MGSQSGSEHLTKADIKRLESAVDEAKAVLVDSQRQMRELHEAFSQHTHDTVRDEPEPVQPAPAPTPVQPGGTGQDSPAPVADHPAPPEVAAPKPPADSPQMAAKTRKGGVVRFGRRG